MGTLLGTLLPHRFDFVQFQQMTPLNEVSVWLYIVERNAERIGVKRRKPALENLEKIFGATFRLANEVGFRAMSLRDLCRETGLSMGGLYGYIDSKDQLAEMIEDVVRHATLELPRMLGHISAPIERLEALVRATIYLSEILQPWFYFVYMDSRVLNFEQRAMAKQSELSIQSMFAAIIDEITPQRPGSSTLLAAHILAMLQDWYVKRWKYGAAKVHVDDYADSTWRVIGSHLGQGSCVQGSCVQGSCVK
jgi:AcrR family transcriptional regulator